VICKAISSGVMGGHTDWRFDSALGCGPIGLVGYGGTDPCGRTGREVLREVGEVTLTGSKHGN